MKLNVHLMTFYFAHCKLQNVWNFKSNQVTNAKKIFLDAKL